MTLGTKKRYNQSGENRGSERFNGCVHGLRGAGRQGIGGRRVMAYFLQATLFWAMLYDSSDAIGHGLPAGFPHWQRE